ncbi:MAG: polysaccharide export protein [Epsilonproteobacteria bacterium]|nr:polysaccharide export protein [Campylobacterota bacterium]
MIRVIIYIFLTFTILGCNSKKLRDEYIFFNKTENVSEGRKSENLNREIVTKVEPVKFEYKIQPHDRVSIRVYKHPELSTGSSGGLGESLLVSSDGTVTLPLINEVQIAGITQPEAQKRLEGLYREYLKHPTVQLEVLNKRAFILGEVKNPGPVEIRNEQIPLLQLLSIAGDLTLRADRDSIMILKNYGDRVQTKIVSLINRDSLRNANLMIKPNDIVYVIPKDMGIFNNKIDEINPVFRLISNALTPFLTVRALVQ